MVESMPTPINSGIETAKCGIDYPEQTDILHRTQAIKRPVFDVSVADQISRVKKTWHQFCFVLLVTIERVKNTR